MIRVAPQGSRPVSYNASKDVRDPVLAAGVSGKQFTRALTVDDAAKLKAGDVVQLQWFSVDGPKSRILKSLRSEEHTSELQSLVRISYAVFCLKKKKNNIY